MSKPVTSATMPPQLFRHPAMVQKAEQTGEYIENGVRIKTYSMGVSEPIKPTDPVYSDFFRGTKRQSL